VYLTGFVGFEKVSICQPLASSIAARVVEILKPKPGGDFSVANWRSPLSEDLSSTRNTANYPLPIPHNTASSNSQAIDPLFLFACHFQWEREEEPSAAWELLAAAQSTHGDTRAHARALLAHSRHLGGTGSPVSAESPARPRRAVAEHATVNAPSSLEIIDNCSECNHCKPGFFCSFSQAALQALNQVSHKSTLPAGAVLFVEGQSPRGVFIVCSGRVNLSTTSREGKILILKTAEPGEVLGLSAAISGAGYETTAETATPCQLNFVDRQHLLDLMQSHSEIGVRTAQFLSRDFQSAYRDIRDLVLTRSSAGKLARLLLAQSSPRDIDSATEIRIGSSMTHEEMAQRIGSSRETVTRLLSDLKKRHLIRLDGSTLVIPDRSALEAMAV
jgi:CRP/FNR family transcriptional regulator, cyclic AMP receptor protein